MSFGNWLRVRENQLSPRGDASIGRAGHRAQPGIVTPVVIRPAGAGLGEEKSVLIVHHLNESRSQRILWLLEELGVPYEIVKHERDAVTRLAPPALKAVHPLGKSPVIVDAGVTVAESGAITDYLIRTYGKGGFMPATGTPAYEAYNQWLHFAEGSAMLPFLLALYTGRLGEAAAPLMPRIQSEIANHVGYIAASLGDQTWIMGDALTGADILLSFPAEIAVMQGLGVHFPNLKTYVERIHARPAFKRGLERGGPYSFAAS
jgi:glutathione S-transferase